MLLLDTNPSDFRVPTVPQQTRKPHAVPDDPLRRRNERDARLTAAHERARARVEMLKMFAQDDQQSAGLVKRTEAALKTYKASTGALKGDDFAALARDVRAQALEREAMARARARVVQTGKTLDTLIEAARQAPENVEAHAGAAREAIEVQKLPAKVEAALRARLSEIPEAALSTLIERDPAHAAKLIKRREGPADATFGLDRATLRVLSKQAAGAIDEAEAAQADAVNVAALRAHADAANAIAAAQSGEGDEAGLTAWLAEADTIGPNATRKLRRESKAAAKTVAARKAAVAAAREKLARAEDIADADDDTIDPAFAAATKAGFAPADAAQYLRDAPDLSPTDRDRRMTDFDRTVGGKDLARAIEQTFNIRITGIGD